MNDVVIRAVEFFSGIGAFACAVKGSPVKIVASYDQGEDANRVHELNFGTRPRTRNLDSISAEQIPAADLWWLSPPCTPYTVRGLQQDDMDNRSRSLKNLIELLSDKLPSAVFVENVLAFEQSKMFESLTERLTQLNYSFQVEKICPTLLGIPMKRPRIFVAATRKPLSLKKPTISPVPTQPLRAFIDSHTSGMSISKQLLSQHGEGMHIISLTQTNPYAICFTSGYAKSFRASGSFLQDKHGVRRFSPREILSMLGFPPDFEFPPDMDAEVCWRLVGNSVDVRSIRHIIRSVEGPGKWVEILPE